MQVPKFNQQEWKSVYLLNKERISALLDAPPFCPGKLPSKKRSAATMLQRGEGDDSDDIYPSSEDGMRAGSARPSSSRKLTGSPRQRKQRIEFSKADDDQIAKWLSKYPRTLRDKSQVFKKFVEAVRIV
jgi:hypothetical protein